LGRCGGFFSFSWAGWDALAITKLPSKGLAGGDPSTADDKIVTTNSRFFALDIRDRFRDAKGELRVCAGLKCPNWGTANSESLTQLIRVKHAVIAEGMA